VYYWNAMLHFLNWFRCCFHLLCLARWKAESSALSNATYQPGAQSSEIFHGIRIQCLEHVIAFEWLGIVYFVHGPWPTSNTIVFQKLPLLCLPSANIFFCLFLIIMLALCQHFLLLFFYYWTVVTVNNLLMHALIFPWYLHWVCFHYHGIQTIAVLN
jgi:hypothetical protein